METIQINHIVKSHLDGKTLQNVHCGSFFEDFLQAQKQRFLSDGTYKKNGLTAEGAATFREETVNVLNHCNPHDAYEAQEMTHLVVGYVQSGKTMSFTGLTALAKDNGYRLVVYLAGTKKNLVEQTTARLEKDLVGQKQENGEHYKLHADPKEDEMDEIIRQMYLSSHPMILIPILKRANHIDELTKLFENNEFKEVMGEETVLIIDDEADQASLNAYGRKNSKSDDEEVSSTYNAILKMRAVLPGNTYVQYTATPQANLLISMQDLLSPKSHTLLTPGEGYIGGELYFGRGANHDLFNGGLIMQIPESQVFHKKRNPLKKIPKSLEDALRLHILAVAIVVKWRKTDGVKFLSMMVHPDETKKWNSKFKKWIDTEIKNWNRAARKDKSSDDYVFLMQEFKRMFDEAVKFYDEDERPLWDEIEPLLPDVIGDSQVHLVNSEKEADVNITWHSCGMHILVGAEMLNRGFTIENLATTYMPRHTLGATNADTIQQRCRFFGYKRDYIKSCRVFLPKVSIDNYLVYITHEEELRNTLASCDTLAAAERKILLSPTLRPTRSNVLPVTVVNTTLKGMSTFEAFQSAAVIDNNRQTVEQFLQTHLHDFEEDKYKYDTDVRSHRSLDLSIDEAIEFLGNFRFANLGETRRKADTIRYLSFLADKQIIKSVHFVQMAWKAEPLRKRGFNYDTHKITSQLLMGRSTEDDGKAYPGDAKIVDGETITIQLHHIAFMSTILDFPSDAYTLAINYPDSLAATYIGTEEVKKEEIEAMDDLDETED